MGQIDTEVEYSELEQQLIVMAAQALIANLQQIDEWTFISNAIAIAAAEMLMRCDCTDAVRLEMVDELAQGIRANLMGTVTHGMTRQ